MFLPTVVATFTTFIIPATRPVRRGQPLHFFRRTPVVTVSTSPSQRDRPLIQNRSASPRVCLFTQGSLRLPVTSSHTWGSSSGPPLGLGNLDSSRIVQTAVDVPPISCGCQFVGRSPGPDDTTGLHFHISLHFSFRRFILSDSHGGSLRTCYLYFSFIIIGCIAPRAFRGLGLDSF
jgi:hypothetical protein